MSEESQKWFKAGQFISDTEREFLLGGEVKHESSVRYRIRHKMMGALRDLSTAGSKLPNRDAEKLFEGAGQISRIDTRNGKEIMPGQEAELIPIIALGCRGYKLNGKSVDQFISNVIETGIKKGVADSEDVSPNNVFVDIELKDCSVHESFKEIPPIERIDKREPLTHEEWQQVRERLKQELNRESIGFDELPELAREHLIESDE